MSLPKASGVTLAALRYEEKTGAHRAPTAVKLLVVFVMLSITVFSRMGIRLGSYSLDVSIVAMYVFVLGLFVVGFIEIVPKTFVLYSVAIFVVLLSYAVNENASAKVVLSTDSMFLLIVIHLPLIWSVKAPSNGAAVWIEMMRTMANVMLLCAVVGITQFCAQFFINAPWLFDFASYLPLQIQGPQGFNTVIPVGALFKANGFFLREPSHFSFVAALGVLFEITLFKRMWRLALFGLALLLSYSGTGILALLIGLMFPFERKTLVRALAIAILGFVVMLTLGDALNLSFTVGRVAEFNNEDASAYIRYVAPLRFLDDTFASVPWAPLLGHGPGTMRRTTTGFEFFDPTWARLLFEYGLSGFTLFTGLFWLVINRSPAPIQIRMAIFAYWMLMGGNLLLPDAVALVYVTCGMWPQSGRADGLSRPIAL